MLTRLNQTSCITGIRIINLNTLWFVKLLSQNLSRPRNALHMHWYLMLWTASAALYFCVYTRKWMAPFEYRNRLGWFILSLNCLGMVFSVLLLYTPCIHATPLKQHTRLVMGSTILYILLTFHMLCELLTRDIATFQKAAGPYAMLVVSELLFCLSNGGISTLPEICLPMTMSLYSYTVNSFFSRRNGFSE